MSESIFDSNTPSLKEFFGIRDALKLCEILKFPTEFSPYVMVSDVSENGELVMLHYNHKHMAEIAHVKGVVVERNTLQIVSRSFGNIQEYEEIPDKYVNYKFPAEARVFKDGAVIRVFRHDSVLYTITHKKFAGENAKWQNQNFVELLLQSVNLNDIQDSLTHLYVVNSTLMRNVAPVENDYYCEKIATYNPETDSFTHLTKTYTVNSVEEIQSLLESLSQYDSGLVISNGVDDTFRVFTHQYTVRNRLRNGEVSLRMRYALLYFENKGRHLSLAKEFDNVSYEDIDKFCKAVVIYIQYVLDERMSGKTFICDACLHRIVVNLMRNKNTTMEEQLYYLVSSNSPEFNKLFKKWKMTKTF